MCTACIDQEVSWLWEWGICGFLSSIWAGSSTLSQLPCYWISSSFTLRGPSTSCLTKECFLLFSHSVVSDSLLPRGLQHIRLPCPSPSPRACSNSRPLVTPSNHLILCHSLLLPPSIFPSVRVFSNELALHIRWLKFQLQHQFFQWICRTDFL